MKTKLAAFGTLLGLSAFCSGSAQAYLISDFGFTQLEEVVGAVTLRAKVHSILNFDSAYAPGKYDYVYQVTNTGNVAIEWFGVFGGNLGLINTDLCQVAAIGVPPPDPTAAAACAQGAGATLPSWVSNLTRPDLTWQIIVEADQGLPGANNAANYGVSWGNNVGFGPGQTRTFQVASANAPIVGGAWIDPTATSSGFYVRDATGNTAEANYVPEPGSIALLLLGLVGVRTVRPRTGRR